MLTARFGDLAGRVATVLGVSLPSPSPRVGNKRYPTSSALSMVARGNPRSAKGRKVAILAADGVDLASLQSMKSALLGAGANIKVLSARLGELRGAAGGGTVKVDDLMVTMPSIMFDAVYVPGGADSIAALKASGDAVHFVRKAFKHAKATSASGEGAEFLVSAGVLGLSKSAGVATAAGSEVAGLSAEFLADIAAHRHWSRPSHLVAA